MDIEGVMTPDPACCTADTALRDVARMMIDNDCGEIPVVDASNTPVGVVTDRDIVVRVIATGRDPATTRAGDCMSTPVTTVCTDSSVEDCCEVMQTKQLRRVPVVDRDGRLRGIVSLADVALAGRDRQTGEVVQQVSEPARPGSH